jgi:hypothetical protein
MLACALAMLLAGCASARAQGLNLWNGKKLQLIHSSPLPNPPS